MLNALLYLRVTSFRNWVISRARRLRQPKYLIGAVVGCADATAQLTRGKHHAEAPLSRVQPPNRVTQMINEFVVHPLILEYGRGIRKISARYRASPC